MTNAAKSDSSENRNENAKIKFVPSKFIVHKFTSEVTEKTIIYQVLKMTDSLFIIINDKNNPQLETLSLALTNRYDNLPIGTRLIGHVGEEVSKNMACRLNKKLGKTVYVSCNLQEDHMFIPLVEKRLYQEFINKPEAF